MRPDGRIARANETFAHWVGVPPDNLAGIPFASLLTLGSRIHFDTRFAPLLARQGAAEGMALELLRPGGRSPLSVLTHATLVRQRRQTVGVRLTLFDRSDRKGFESELTLERRKTEEAQGRFERLFEAAPDALLLLDKNGTIVIANAEAQRLFGTPRTELVGQSIESRVLVGREPSASRPLSLGPFLQVGSRPAEWVVLQASGNRVPVEARLNSMQETPDSQVIANLRDVTDRLAFEQERQAAERQRDEIEMLRKMNQVKVSFIGTAAHELRTPLASIRMQVAVLSKFCKGIPEVDRGLAVLERNVERMANLAEDLLTIANEQAGRVALRLVPIDLGSLVEEIVVEFRPNAEQKSIQINVEPQDTPPVMADPRRIAQVLNNLLGNAVKFTPSGGRVGIEFKVRSDVVGVQVSDTGIGITGEDLDRVFAPFVQVHDVRDFSEPGSGLGLYISQQIIHMHGGKMGLESPGRGRGSTAWFTLPRVRHARANPSP